MFNNPKNTRNVALLITGLLTIAGIFLWLYLNSDFSFYGHLSATFIEVAISILLVDLYLENSRKKESFHVYSIARNYIFGRVYNHFNRVLFKNFDKKESLKNLGQRPSFDTKFIKNLTLQTLTKKILESMNTEDFKTIRTTIIKDFENIEKLYNLNIVYHNQDLFAAISRFVDICYYIQNIEYTANSFSQCTQEMKEKYFFFVETWLYIINNFMYFSKHSSLVTQIDDEIDDYKKTCCK